MAGPAHRPSPRAPAAEPDEAKVVAFPVACIKCGYDLRGLRLTGACPECGAPVERSLHGDELADSPRAWLLSQRVVSLAAAGHIWTLGLLALVIGPLDGFLGGWYLRTYTAWGAFSPAGLLCAGGAGAIVLGALRKERPGDVHADAASLWRHWTMLGLFILHAAMMLALLFLASVLGAAATTLALGGVILGVIAHAMLAARQRQLAQRIPDADLATSLQMSTVLFAIWIAALLLFPRACACCLAVPLGIAVMAALSASYGRFGQALYWIVHDIQPAREIEQAARAARREAARTALQAPSEPGSELVSPPPPPEDPWTDGSQPLPPIDLEPPRDKDGGRPAG